MTRICFLVPTFNRAPFISEALDAILVQAEDADEILVIDDGSIDETSAIVSRFAPRVRYVRQDNAGKAAALNRGLSTTKARYLWVCDDDDVLLPGAVAALWNASHDGTTPLVFGRYQRFRDEQGVRSVFSPGYRPDLGRGSIVRHVLEDLFVMQNATLVATDAVRSIGGFSETLARSVDYELFVRLFTSFPAVFVDHDIFLQRQHDQVRGPAATPVSRDRNEAVWLQADSLIFRSLAAHAPISFFQAMFDGPAGAVERAAYLERAVVMARHDCWDLACDDFEAAALMPGRGLDGTERAICRRALCGKHEIAGVLAKAVVGRLRTVAKRNEQGRSIVGSIIRGGLWRLRQANHRDKSVVTRLVTGLPLETAWGLLGVASQTRVTEREELNPAAFLEPGTLPVV